MFPVVSCISLLWEFAALRALSESHHINGMLQCCVMNISIFGRGADVVAALLNELTLPWSAGGVLYVVVLSGVLPVGTGLLPLTPPSYNRCAGRCYLCLLSCFLSILRYN